MYARRKALLDLVKEEGATLVDLDKVVQVKNQGRFQRFEIARAAYEADAIINLPKLKTHGMTTLTGAVKNLFGCVPGKRKVQWHFNTGVNHELFAVMLIELCSLLNPRLTIMDAVIGMEGNGPGSGEPRQIGVVIAGQDPVAVDVVSSSVVGVAPERLPLIRAALAAGYGETRPTASGSLAKNCRACRSGIFGCRRKHTWNGRCRNGRVVRSRTPLRRNR